MKFKKLIQQIFATICFSVGSVSAAPISVDMTSEIWTIAAFDTGGNDWSGSTLTFETQVANNDDWRLTGYFDWMNDTVFFGTENFTGTLLSDGSLQLEGFELCHPLLTPA